MEKVRIQSSILKWLSPVTATNINESLGHVVGEDDDKTMGMTLTETSQILEEKKAEMAQLVSS